MIPSVFGTRDDAHAKYQCTRIICVTPRDLKYQAFLQSWLNTYIIIPPRILCQNNEKKNPTYNYLILIATENISTIFLFKLKNLILIILINH